MRLSEPASNPLPDILASVILVKGIFLAAAIVAAPKPDTIIALSIYVRFLSGCLASLDNSDVEPIRTPAPIAVPALRGNFGIAVAIPLTDLTTTPTPAPSRILVATIFGTSFVRNKDTFCAGFGADTKISLRLNF